jgi:hypothetical protein
MAHNTNIFGKPKKFFSIPVLILFLASPLCGDEPGIFPGTDFSRILNRPQVISSLITGETLDDKSRWISMDVDVHVFTDKPFKKLRSTTELLEEYPRYFKRLKNASVASTPDGLFFEMFVSVGLLGISYDTNYVMRVTRPVDDAHRLLLDYVWYAGDGLVKDDAWGRWYIESATSNGIEGTYVRFVVHGTVLNKYPLQESAMRTFVNSEYEDVLKQFLKAADR